jgi:hypothetical protein
VVGLGGGGCSLCRGEAPLGAFRIRSVVVQQLFCEYDFYLMRGKRTFGNVRVVVVPQPIYS